jgi:hypothetical protein
MDSNPFFGARAFTKDFMPAVVAACAAGIQHFEAVVALASRLFIKMWVKIL